jgi:hypothetical protein
MKSTRRNFLKTSAALGVAGTGASEALADTTDPWIGVLHSTALDGQLEDDFLQGLRNQNWEGDPTQRPSPGRKKVVIRKINGRGKYGGTYSTALTNAATDLNEVTPGTKLKLFAAFGGIVSARAFATINSRPILVVLGRNDVFPLPQPGQKIGGYDMKGGKHSERIARLLTYYSVPANRVCLFYNGNSAMAQKEIADWTFGGPAPFNGTNADNDKMDVAAAIEGAIAKFTDTTTPFAIVISADPYFTSKRAEIIRAVLERQASLTNLVICYPFSEYYNEAMKVGAANAQTMGYGPSLSDIYRGIGEMAGRFLTDPSTTLTITDVAYQFNGAPS